MWYKLAIKRNRFNQLIRGNPKNTRLFAEDDDDNDVDVAQLPNIQEEDTLLDEIPSVEELPIQEQPLVEVPTQIEPVVETPIGVKNKTPVPIVYPPNFKVPPVHEFCHCTIKTLPSGQQIWELGNGENHCAECVNLRQIFNSLNEKAYNSD